MGCFGLLLSGENEVENERFSGRRSRVLLGMGISRSWSEERRVRVGGGFEGMLCR